MAPICRYTLEEEQAIDELKRRTINDVTPRMLEDETLFYRFLKARNFNVDNAEILLRKHLSDRKIYGIDEVSKYIPLEYADLYVPFNFIGFDKEGFIVRYSDLGGGDFKGLTNLYDTEKFFQYIYHSLEKDADLMNEQTKKFGKPLTKMTFIINTGKLSLFTVTNRKVVEWGLKGFKLYQDNFPERIKKIYIINAGYYTHIGIAVVKHVLADELVKKIHIYTSDWKEVLLNEIDADVLPAFLGGNRTDPDGNPLCNSFINHGRIVPEELYMKKRKISIKNEIGVQTLTVTRFSSSEIMLQIVEPNTHIEWEFETKSKDIAFALYYKHNSDKNSKHEVLVPKQKIDTMLSSETGIYKCPRIGTYIISFDNSYSWFFSKEIYYRIRLMKPQEIEMI